MKVEDFTVASLYIRWKMVKYCRLEITTVLPAKGATASTLEHLDTNLLIVSLKKGHTSEALNMHSNKATIELTCTEG